MLMTFSDTRNNYLDEGIPEQHPLYISCLLNWGRVTHICVSKLTIIGSDNGLSPGRRQAIIWTNAGILLIRTLGTYFSEILGEINSFSLKKMHSKMSYVGGRLFSIGLNELSYVFILVRTFSVEIWLISDNCFLVHK